MASNILGTGLSVPVAFKEGKVELAEGSESVKAAIRFLFSTRRGERFMLPTFGTRTWSLLFEGIGPEMLQLLEVYAEEEIRTWIPRIQRVDTRATQTDEHIVELLITYWLRNRTTPEMMVYPFYLEGYRG